jgi:uncharacterized phage protein (TIGR01671 family)
MLKVFTIGEISNADHWEYVCNCPLIRNYKFIGYDEFTGLKDASGKEIYEGDIIECEYHPDLLTTKGIDLIWRGFVEYGPDAAFHTLRKGYGSYAVGYGGSAVKRWEVVGNIHENPELLET